MAIKKEKKQSGLEGSCPICRLGEITYNKCNRCGVKFCTKCGGNTNGRAWFPCCNCKRKERKREYSLAIKELRYYLDCSRADCKMVGAGEEAKMRTSLRKAIATLENLDNKLCFLTLISK